MAIQTWTLDPVHSTIGFTVRHLVVTKVHGRFARWHGTLQVDEENPEASQVEVHIEAGSVDTHDATRDAHLRTGDFFEVEKYPEIVFRGTGVRRVDVENLEVNGNLTLHGVTRPVVLQVEYQGKASHPQMGERAGFSARTSISRKDFGMTFNQILETGGLGLSDKVDINLDVEAIIPAPVKV